MSDRIRRCSLLSLALAVVLSLAPPVRAHAEDGGYANASAPVAHAPLVPGAPALPAAPAADPVADPVADTLALAKALSDSATPWTLKLGLALVLLVGLLRKYAKRIPWGVGVFFGSTEGGSTLLLLTTFGATFGAALSAGKPLTLGLAGGALGLALGAAGGWEVALKPLIEKVFRPALSHLLPGLFPPSAVPNPAAKP